jgi:hypothetical protein
MTALGGAGMTDRTKTAVCWTVLVIFVATMFVLGGNWIEGEQAVAD